MGTQKEEIFPKKQKQKNDLALSIDGDTRWATSQGQGQFFLQRITFPDAECIHMLFNENQRNSPEGMAMPRNGETEKVGLQSVALYFFGIAIPYGAVHP